MPNHQHRAFIGLSNFETSPSVQLQDMSIWTRPATGHSIPQTGHSPGNGTNLTSKPFPRYFPRMKAPNFTSDNARMMALRSVASRKENRKREKEAFEAGRQAALDERPTDDDARKVRVQRQIDILLTDMEKTKSVDVRLRIAAALDRLWKLVTPTAGVLRPKNRPSGAVARPAYEPVPVDSTPQAEVPATDGSAT